MVSERSTNGLPIGDLPIAESELGKPLIVHKYFTFDPNTHLVKTIDQEVSRLPLKVELFLNALWERKNRFVFPTQIARAIWHSDLPETSNVRVYASLLRKAVGHSPERQIIDTKQGMGYRLIDPDGPPGRFYKHPKFDFLIDEVRIGRVGKEPIDLTFNEARLLARLVQHEGETVAYRRLIADIRRSHGKDLFSSIYALRVYMTHLRRKLGNLGLDGSQIIVNQEGLTGGYKLSMGPFSEEKDLPTNSG